MVHLDELEGQVSGTAPTVPPLATITPGVATHRIDGPPPGGLVLDVTTDQRTAVDVVPLVGADDLESQRLHRRIRVHVDGTARVDLRPALASWGDAAGLEPTAVEVSAQDGQLARLEFFPIEALRSAASVEQHDQGGFVRPSWVVSQGASVQLTAQAPAGSVLRYHDQGRLVEQPFDGPVTFTGPAAIGAPRVLTPAAAGCVPDVLLLVIDTLRADAVPDMPTVAALAAAGIDHTSVWSSSAWTKPAMPSLLTGQLSTVHRVGALAYTEQLAPEAETLQDRFRQGGYRTASFVSNPLGGALSGLDQGFDLAVQPGAWPERGLLGHPSTDQLRQTFVAWLDEEPDQPFFAMVHTLEPHEWAGPAYAGDTPPVRYREAVLDADRGVNELLAALEARGRRDNTLVVVVSDHGESLGERNLIGHGSALFEEQVRIPFIVAGPGVQPTTRTALTSLVDVAPTLLELAGLPPLQDIDGQPVSAGDRDHVHASILRYLAETDTPPQHARRMADDKLMVWEDGRHLRYDLATDPGELDPRQAPTQRDDVLADIAAQAARGEALGLVGGTSDAAEVDDALRALGYLE